jgi:hypothetical protein
MYVRSFRRIDVDALVLEMFALIVDITLLGELLSNYLIARFMIDG